MDKLKNIKAIIFDFDGTIVDSESVWLKVYPDAFKKIGLDVTKEQLLTIRSAGYPLRDQLFKQWYNLQNPRKTIDDIEDVAIEMIKEYTKKHPIQLKPYIIETLIELKKINIPIVIASSSKREFIEEKLKKLNIHKYFDEIYSASETKLKKPYPDIYLFVCKELGLDPKDCIAIEDCPNGVISACKAGCQTIMVPDLTEPDEELIKNYKFKVIHSLKELLKII